jgi:hypothetical protein
MAPGWLYSTGTASLLAWSLILGLTLTLILVGGLQRRQSQATPTVAPDIPRTLRIQGIPTNVTHNELLNQLENLSYHSDVSMTNDKKVLQLSLVRKDRQGACATVTFRSLPSPLETIERKSRIVHGYAYDIKFLGITPVHEGLGQRDSIIE